jgi:hypothetical protein
MESSRTTNYWPGFVDALTNTVIAMVFLVIVLTIALSAFVNLVVKQRTAKLVQQSMDTMATSTARAAPAPVQFASSPATPRSGSSGPSTSLPASLLTGEIVVTAPEPQKQLPARPALDRSGKALVLRFPEGGVDLDAKSTDALNAIAERSGIQMSQMYADIAVRGPEILLSENQRSGFFRAMSARNYLMEKGMPAANLFIRFEDAPGITEHQIVISISPTPPGVKP